MRPLFIGEDNPYGADPRYALYPYPGHSAGGRLCFKILGLTEKEYIKRFDRMNLCDSGKWSTKEAAKRVEALYVERGLDPAPFVLLGSKVTKAFKLRFEPFTLAWQILGGVERRIIAILPHPSGLNRLWNEENAFARARDVLRRADVLSKEPV